MGLTTDTNNSKNIEHL